MGVAHVSRRMDLQVWLLMKNFSVCQVCLSVCLSSLSVTIKNIKQQTIRYVEKKRDMNIEVISSMHDIAIRYIQQQCPFNNFRIRQEKKRNMYQRTRYPCICVFRK